MNNKEAMAPELSGADLLKAELQKPGRMKLSTHDDYRHAPEGTVVAHGIDVAVKHSNGHPIIFPAVMRDTTFTDANAMANILAGDVYTKERNEQ